METRGKFSVLPVTYINAHSMTSIRVGRAFAEGCKGKTMSSFNKLFGGPFAAWCDPVAWPLLREAQKIKLDWFYIDHAYFRRRQYFRITKNAYQHDGRDDAANGQERFAALDWPIKPWTRNGRRILLCPQSDTFFGFYGMTRAAWISSVTEELRKHTDRPIEVHTKTPGSKAEAEFAAAVSDAHAAIVFTSVAGVQAALAGVPCFATANCASLSFGTGDLSRIEKPVKPDNREELAWALACNQWTIDEIKRGDAWKKIR
jgi:hypothetical protein